MALSPAEGGTTVGTAVGTDVATGAPVVGPLGTAVGGAAVVAVAEDPQARARTATSSAMKAIRPLKLNKLDMISFLTAVLLGPR